MWSKYHWTILLCRIHSNGNAGTAVMIIEVNYAWNGPRTLHLLSMLRIPTTGWQLQARETFTLFILSAIRYVTSHWSARHARRTQDEFNLSTLYVIYRLCHRIQMLDEDHRSLPNLVLHALLSCLDSRRRNTYCQPNTELKGQITQRLSILEANIGA